jgi:hypothetical protein
LLVAISSAKCHPISNFEVRQHPIIRPSGDVLWRSLLEVGAGDTLAVSHGSRRTANRRLLSAAGGTG